MSEAKDYNAELQKLFLEFLVNDGTLLSRTTNIIAPEYFDVSIRPAVKFVIQYYNDYNAVPKVDQIAATTTIQLRELAEIGEEHGKWFLDEFEQFCKYKALERAIVKSADLLENQEYGKVEKIIKEAVEIGLAKTFGTDYFSDPEGRLNELRNRNASTPTGWEVVDQKLYGGFDRGTLNLFAAPSGGGKSLFLQNLALNWSLAGLNVAYISLELSEGLCSMRMDAMITATPTREIYKNLSDVDLKVRMAGKKAGKLQIVQLPNGITTNDIKAWMKEFQIQTGTKFDAVLIDYMDLMMPAGQKINLADLFIKDKLVSEELRNFAIESNIIGVSAVQLNRGATDAVEFDHSHISGGISKIQTSDNVMGIFSNPSMREKGRVQVQFLKTRNSSGVGSKVELAMCPNTLRITNLAEDDDETKPISASAMFSQLQRRSVQERTGQPSGQASLEKPDLSQSVVNRSEQLRNLLRK